MNNDEQNWENTIDWDRFDPPAGGREFFDYMKTSLPTLDEAIRLLRADYERETARLASQAEVMRLAERLQKEFDAISGSETFQRILAAMDSKVRLLFPHGEGREGRDGGADAPSLGRLRLRGVGPFGRLTAPEDLSKIPTNSRCYSSENYGIMCPAARPRGRAKNGKGQR